MRGVGGGGGSGRRRQRRQRRPGLRRRPRGTVHWSPWRGVRRPTGAPRTLLPRPPATGSSLAAEAARRPPYPSTSTPTPPPAAFLVSLLLPSAPLLAWPGPARPGRGPPPCLRSWQRHPARGKSSPGISCGLAWFRLLPPRPRRPPAPQPHSGPPCLSCDRTDTAGGLEWNKLKVK